MTNSHSYQQRRFNQINKRSLFTFPIGMELNVCKHHWSYLYMIFTQLRKCMEMELLELNEMMKVHTNSSTLHHSSTHLIRAAFDLGRWKKDIYAASKRRAANLHKTGFDGAISSSLESRTWSFVQQTQIVRSTGESIRRFPANISVSSLIGSCKVRYYLCWKQLEFWHAKGLTLSTTCASTSWQLWLKLHLYSWCIHDGCSCSNNVTQLWISI